MREELEENKQQINKMTEELDKLDTELQQTRQDLYQEQLTSSDYEGQVYSFVLVSFCSLLRDQ